MRPLATAALVALVLTCGTRSLRPLLGAVESLPAEGPSFTLAVLRRDGVLIPFAAHHDGRWRQAWPTPGRPAEVPIAVTDVPEDWWGKTAPTLTWTLWPFDGPPRPVRATVPIRYQAQCLPGIGFRTDYTPERPVPPPFERPFPKDGLGASAPVKVEKIDVLDERAPEWGDFERRLADSFTKAENNALVGYTRFTHPMSRRDRQKVPVTIEALYRAPVRDAGEIYYVEATRRYDDPRQKDGCDLLTFTAGWIRPWKPAREVFDIGAAITYCDRAAAEFLLPLGAIRFEARPAVWVAQAAGWDHERYLVIETARDGNKVLINAYGGGCARPGG